jgi:hypothetical protein
MVGSSTPQGSRAVTHAPHCGADAIIFSAPMHQFGWIDAITCDQLNYFSGDIAPRMTARNPDP